MVRNNTIETGTEKKSDVPTKADIFAYVDDGEYATVWAVNRITNTEVDVLTFYCESGLVDQVGKIRTFEIDHHQTTEQWAQEYADAHKTSVKAARDYWNEQ